MKGANGRRKLLLSWTWRLQIHSGFQKTRSNRSNTRRWHKALEQLKHLQIFFIYKKWDSGDLVFGEESVTRHQQHITSAAISITRKTFGSSLSIKSGSPIDNRVLFFNHWIISGYEPIVQPDQRPVGQDWFQSSFKPLTIWRLLKPQPPQTSVDHLTEHHICYFQKNPVCLGCCY